MTSRFVYGEDDRLISWTESRIAGGKFREDARAIGHEKDGELVAVVVYDTFSTTGCFVHLASGARKWMSREFAVVAMTYPFIQCGMARISSMVSARNILSLRFTRQFGWIQEGVMRCAGNDGEDIILFGMLRSECRWLPPPAIWRPAPIPSISEQSTPAHDVRASLREHAHDQIGGKVS